MVDCGTRRWSENFTRERIVYGVFERLGMADRFASLCHLSIPLLIVAAYLALAGAALWGGSWAHALPSSAPPNAAGRSLTCRCALEPAPAAPLGPEQPAPILHRL
jgi:hypothetical protein